MRTTFMAKPDEIERKWVLIDATDISLGRLASVVATVLRGKNKPTYTPHTDVGDNVIVINAGKLKLTGRKATDKIYYHHSQHPGGLKHEVAGDLLKDNPTRLVEYAVKKMLPTKNTLGHQQFLKLHVYAGEEHPHTAQKPEVLDITNLI
ncbi:50S ribosomal protein L13 [Lacticaseibacillus suilingensis]|uniref:Large ribosomal subunit protein uL13 n=1 Tax=Lacticaseibacillus suilingensis TaxID=2799577 RepID=A0ABW4BB43_9LACO|nr:MULTISPECIES: 50S ribosomal protein L13 [Lacticaseibacillus]MCI1894905.1 50S ribosomal protein L13 [Lactobacillus sp.]MCI1917246.1 50S ribosomal protein L13 [Lactobacillus sp.]MCI1973080.1 50S ribosomal protein L13 [Lactobacillus sp.]MCI2016639.1 50S ribosomal protein L13 [Lactobacillus sp.]MCI2037485.1 50S ribosomal protein L13 [Lactobacillus sp.]